MRQNRNISGKLVTNGGRLDLRANNPGTLPLPTAPEFLYDTVQRPNDLRPWHVIQTNVGNGLRNIVSRHVNEKTALKRAGLERAKQTNRKPSRKELHKLGIDGR